MHPVVTDMRKAEAILGWAVEKMEERYHLLARAGVRHISVYNQLGEDELMERIQPEDDEERKQIPTHMPYIVIVADELADLMMTAAKEVEAHIIRLAQKSRAVGIHLVLATQKPTVDVITGLIKSNLPARIAFQVASRTDSRVVLDEMGADKLLGNGDMLFLWPGTSTLLRGQGTYLSDDEISRVIGAVATSEPQFVKELVQLKTTVADGDKKKFSDRDELYESAIDIVIREGRGSVSLLQRALGIGYGRGARLIDFMAEDGIVGTYNGSQAREVLITLEQWEEMSGQGSGAAPAAPAKPPRSNKILMEPPAEERLSSGAIHEVKPVDDEDNGIDEQYDEFDEDEDPPFDTGRVNDAELTDENTDDPGETENKEHGKAKEDKQKAVHDKDKGRVAIDEEEANTEESPRISSPRKRWKAESA
jgi:S-DNA-T family DNA segregation ATPase FtsK/SpoIIIE